MPIITGFSPHRGNSDSLDISDGSGAPKDTNVSRERRFESWFPLLPLQTLYQGLRNTAIAERGVGLDTGNVYVGCHQLFRHRNTNN